MRRDYILANSIIDKARGLQSLENDIILLIDKEEGKEKKGTNSLTNFNTRFILEDIRRTSEHGSDTAEAAMNQTIDEIIEKKGSNSI